MRKKILSFGELLLRMSPKMNLGWADNQSIPTFLGGAELNTSIALANWGLPIEYMTALPQNAFADEVMEVLAQKNIGTSKVIRSGERIGLYFLPQGTDLKNGGVIYDRAHSSFASLQPMEIDWATLFDDVEWLHISAISPALNEKIAELCVEAAKEAKKAGLTVSIDLNFRSTLWKYGKKPIEIMPNIVQNCDLVMGNLWAANRLLGIDLDPKVAVNDATKNEYLSQAEAISKEVMASFKNCKYVANTFRFDTQKRGISYYTTLYSSDGLVVSPNYEINKVTDKVGSGDCFMAGLIYGFYKKHDTQKIINFASAAAIGKLGEVGDASSQTISDVESILEKYL
jgi:2-dehydro-3-deoxygluconokinase